MHETRYHDRSCFLTLTYQQLPPTGSLSKRDAQLFLKRLRKTRADQANRDGRTATPIRYFLCGEYGDQRDRPHYHAILWGEDFAADRKFLKRKKGHRLDWSEELERLWGHGFASLGTVTFESAAYVAKYATERLTGPKAEEVYQGRQPEFGLMSTGRKDWRGIGYRHVRDFGKEIFLNDSIIVNGHEAKPPRYYERVWEEFGNKDQLEKIKQSRKQKAQDNPNNTKARLAAREVAATARAARRAKQGL